MPGGWEVHPPAPLQGKSFDSFCEFRMDSKWWVLSPLPSEAVSTGGCESQSRPRFPQGSGFHLGSSFHYSARWYFGIEFRDTAELDWYHISSRSQPQGSGLHPASFALDTVFSSLSFSCTGSTDEKENPFCPPPFAHPSRTSAGPRCTKKKKVIQMLNIRCQAVLSLKKKSCFNLPACK